MTSPPDYGPLGSAAEIARYEELRPRLVAIAKARRDDPDWEQTSIVVPSLSVNQVELAKVEGSGFYEERLLFALIRLAHPGARMVYVTSLPVHTETIEYYLQHLPGVPISHARRRLLVLCLHDATPKPLTAKLLERPRALERVRAWMGPPERAYLTVYNSTPIERRLAVELGIPLNAVDPALLWLGTKAGSRKVFAEAGVPFAEGTNDVRSRDEVLDALEELTIGRPGLRRAVVKLNDSFAGEGNGVFEFPPRDGAGPIEWRSSLSDALDHLSWPGGRETPKRFFEKLEANAGVVEEWVDGAETRSPSVQMRIHPDGELALVSSHDQVLGGATGQVYLGCHFPAHDEYRALVIAEARKIGVVLCSHGVIGRFGIDFVTTREPGGAWRCHAVEINLRMGGTTPPFMALEFLTGGRLDEQTGLYTAADGRPRYYFATDNLKSPAYRGLLPEDLFDLSVEHGIRFKQTTLTGVMFFMIGGLSQYGKVGVMSIGTTPEEAGQLYRTTVAILDRETGAVEDDHGTPRSLFERSAPSMD